MNDQAATHNSLGLLACVLLAIGYLCLFLRVSLRDRLYLRLNLVHGRDPVSRMLGLSCLYWGSPVLFLAVWGIASYAGWLAGQWLPTPSQLATSGWRLLTSGTLFVEAWISLQRILIGFSSAAILGVTIGFLAGAFVVIRPVVMPANSFLRYIPPTAFIALLIVYFGVGETYKCSVVFLGVIFFIVQMVVDVVDDVDLRYIEMAETSGFSSGQVFWRVIVPSSLPRVFDVLRINLGASWTFLVAAELIGADRGLGHLIAVSQRFLRIGDLFVGILTFGIIGIATDLLLERLGRWWFRWYYLALRR